MSTETKLVRKFNAHVLLIGSRTPVSILEKALELLPDSLLEIVAAEGQPDDLAFYGDNCLGLLLEPRDTTQIRRVNPPSYIKAPEFTTPEGKYVGFEYKGNSYTIKIGNP